MFTIRPYPPLASLAIEGRGTVPATLEASSGRFSDARLSLLLVDPKLGKGAMPGLAKLLALRSR